MLDMHRGNLYRFLQGELTPSMETVGKMLRLLKWKIQVVTGRKGKNQK
jgi:DNA-binding phage protein